MQQKLNDLTNSHHNQWQEKQETWSQQLAMALNLKNIFLSILLSEIEIKELKDQEPLSELSNRFVNLNISMSFITVKNFENYYRLKVYLTIHSALSRQQQPDDESILNKLLKKLDTKFKGDSLGRNTTS